jgi:hypothetical protein
MTWERWNGDFKTTKMFNGRATRWRTSLLLEVKNTTHPGERSFAKIQNVEKKRDWGDSKGKYGMQYNVTRARQQEN